MKRLLSSVGVAVLAVACSAQWSDPAADIPAFHSQPATARDLPPILTGDQLEGPYFTHQYQVVAYRMAAAIPGVLYQQPCYCRCDRALGHKSLRSCFEGTHGAVCSTCMREGVFAYQQTKAGKTPVQIREAIERGDWQQVDITQASL